MFWYGVCKVYPVAPNYITTEDPVTLPRSSFWLGLAVLSAAACADGTDVGLALSTRRPVQTALSSPAGGASLTASVVADGDSTVITMGNDTLIIRSVELVLREIELERIEVDECEDMESDDACEEFETGALLVSLPLGSTQTERVITLQAQPGTFDELEFDVHKPDDVTDAAFIAANPDFADISIRVTGTYSQAGSRSDFTFTSDLNEEQEIDLNPPLVVDEGGATNVTLRLDISRWFVNAGGTALVDPATANNGQANENLVRDNIRASIDVFRDDDTDGLDDEHEGS
jgi:hypothetical protein